MIRNKIETCCQNHCFLFNDLVEIHLSNIHIQRKGQVNYAERITGRKNLKIGNILEGNSKNDEHLLTFKLLGLEYF